MPRYKTGYDPREMGRQLTICFDYTFTHAEMMEAVQKLITLSCALSKNYTFFVHPEMLKEYLKLLDFKNPDDILKGSEENAE